jgi:nickel/cobalt exporter
MLELQRWLYADAGGQLKSLASGIDPLTLLTSISIAALFGLVHAFMPGHGKTVLVSYFLGRPSKVVAGLSASVILVLTHVGSAVVLVLTGFIVVRGTIGGAGRAPEFETASAAFIVLVGFWLLYKAVRHQHQEAPTTDGRVLACATGLVPCPLTTFIMVYAVSNGIIVAGLLLTAGMVLGMVTTIAIFAVAAVPLRDRIVHLMDRTARTRECFGQVLELVSAAAIIGFGLWLLTSG